MSGCAASSLYDKQLEVHTQLHTSMPSIIPTLKRDNHCQQRFRPLIVFGGHLGNTSCIAVKPTWHNGHSGYCTLSNTLHHRIAVTPIRHNGHSGYYKLSTQRACARILQRTRPCNKGRMDQGPHRVLLDCQKKRTSPPLAILNGREGGNSNNPDACYTVQRRRVP